MKNYLIISLLFLSLGFSQKEYNANDLIKMDNGLYTEKFSDSNFRHLNAIRTQRDDLLLLMFIEEGWDGTKWVNEHQGLYTYDSNNNRTVLLSQDWDGTEWVDNRQYLTPTYDANNNRMFYLCQDWDGTEWVNVYQYFYT